VGQHVPLLLGCAGSEAARGDLEPEVARQRGGLVVGHLEAQRGEAHAESGAGGAPFAALDAALYGVEGKRFDTAHGVSP
jgi:hypothetical protein